jgi:hypothetical protein
MQRRKKKKSFIELSVIKFHEMRSEIDGNRGMFA